LLFALRCAIVKVAIIGWSFTEGKTPKQSSVAGLQEADTESTLIILSIIAGIIGTITGVLGLVLAVFINKRQTQELEWQKQELARTNRLTFLADRIFDPTISRELRLPFYEEYLSMGGNGTAVKFWLIEGEREKKTQHLA